MEDVVRAAIEDARALADGGVDAILVENFGDVPFSAGRVDAACVAAMAAVAIADPPRGVAAARRQCAALRRTLGARRGRHGGRRFIRVNVHTGAVVTDQGILTSAAHDTLRYRRTARREIAILADVQTKHAAPLATVPIEHEARDCYARGLADGLIVSGEATGLPPKSDLERVRGAVPEARSSWAAAPRPKPPPICSRGADGLIVGTSVKRDGIVTNPVDVERVRRLVAAARDTRGEAPPPSSR